MRSRTSALIIVYWLGVFAYRSAMFAHNGFASGPTQVLSMLCFLSLILMAFLFLWTYYDRLLEIGLARIRTPSQRYRRIIFGIVYLTALLLGSWTIIMFHVFEAERLYNQSAFVRPGSPRLTFWGAVLGLGVVISIFLLVISSIQEQKIRLRYPDSARGDELLRVVDLYRALSRRDLADRTHYLWEHAQELESGLSELEAIALLNCLGAENREQAARLIASKLRPNVLVENLY